MIAHLVTGSPVPLSVQWLAAAALFGGAVAVASLRRRAWRITAGVVSACGLIGTVTLQGPGGATIALNPNTRTGFVQIPGQHGDFSTLQSFTY